LLHIFWGQPVNEPQSRSPDRRSNADRSVRQSDAVIDRRDRRQEIADGTGQFASGEACDPCEATSNYEIRGVVSDFITPHFYDSVTASGTRHFTGAVTKPRQILPGGSPSFVNQESDEWQQIIYLGSTPQLKTLGPASVTRGYSRVGR
jgi:hypothetical protein